MLYPKNNIRQLAPIYDFVSVAPYLGVFNSSLLALPLLEREEGGSLAHGFNTQYGEYIGDDFVEFGENIGLNKKVIIQKLIPEITKERVKNIYENSFMPQSHIDCILKNYHKRLNLINVLNEPKL